MSDGSANNAKIEILLAEDSATDSAATLKLLKNARICNRVQVFAEGKELLEYIKRPASSERVILLSLKLADGHGLDVLRKIKGDERAKMLPVVILTSSQEECGVMQSYKLGANACIVKPLDLTKLLEAISELQLGWMLISPEEHKNNTPD